MSETTKGLAGVIAADTALSRVDGEKGELIYAGYDIMDLGGQASFEEVIYLLWHGELPNHEQLTSFKAALAAERELHPAAADFMHEIPSDAHPVAVLRTVISYLGTIDPDADDLSMDSGRLKALKLTAAMPTAIAAWERIRNNQEPLAPRADLDHAANFLYMLNGEEPNEAAINAVDAYLVLLADHGLNASTFACRVTTGTLSDMYSAVTSGIGTLKGAAHGGANQKAMEQFIEAAEQGGAEAWFRESRESGKRIMGIGHRVYKTIDPRATILRPLAEELANSSGEGEWFALAAEIERLARQDPYFIDRNLYANVDYYSAVVLFMVGIPVDQFTSLFAMSRSSGWTAHILEQMADNRLIRPKARYVGPEPRAYVPLDERA